MRHLNDKLLKGSNFYDLINNINKRFPDMIIYGKSTQETIKGQQLYDYTKVATASELYTKDEEGFISIDFNNETENYRYYNYYVPISGIKNSTNYNIFLEIKNIEGNGQFALVSNGTGSQFSASFFKNFSELEPNYLCNIIRESNPNADTNDGRYGLRTFITASPGQSGSITFRISVLEDTTITTDDFKYEPFTNGKSAPSPDYPMPIINKKIGNTELCSIDDSKDYIKGKPGEWLLYKKIRKIELPIKDMNNSDIYPGWRQIPQTFQLYEDVFETDLAGALVFYTNYYSNISSYNYGFSTNLKSASNPQIYLGRSIWGEDHTQTYWKENYSDLVVVLQYALKKYEIKKITDKETIEILNAMYLEKIKENQQDIVID